MDKVIDFLEKLNNLTKETGVVIRDYGDKWYEPYLEASEVVVVYFTYDDDKETYVARVDDPYDGPIVFPKELEDSK